MKKWLITIVLLLTVYATASPYWTVYRMKSAAERGDSEALSEYIDFPVLRQNLKDQLNFMMATDMTTELEDNPFAALGAAFSGVMVDRMVDAYVTPVGIRQLMKGEKPTDSPDVEDPDREASPLEALENASMSYAAIDKFKVTIEDETGDEATFVLHRRGLGWKLTNIIIPS